MGGAEMKANELRIGNYVKFPENPDSNYFQVDMIKEEGGDYKYEPISLTEQWLKDFNIKERTVIGETKQRMFIDNIEIPEWIKYVHDLQNWYYYKFEKKELIKK